MYSNKYKSKSFSGDISYLISPDDLPALLKTDDIQSMMNDFYKITGIGIGIIDINGKVLVATGWQDVCTKFHRINKDSLINCLESDLILTQNISQGEFKLYKCKNNLWDISTPLYIGGKHLANIFLGQFLFDDESPDLDYFRAQAKKYNFDEAQYIEALNRVPRWSKDTINTVMNFYVKLAEQISKISYNNLQLQHLLEDNNFLLESHKSSDRQFQNLFNNMHIGVVYQDKEGKIIMINSAAEELLGLSLAQLQGRTSTDPRWRSIKLDGSDFPGSEHPAMISLKTGKPVKDVVMGIYNPATKKHNWILVNATPEFKDNEKYPFQVYTTFIDITKLINIEKRLRESEEKYRLITENAADVIWVLDIHNLKFEYVSPSVFKSSGFTPEEMMEIPVTEVIHPESLEYLQERIMFALSVSKNNSDVFTEKHRIRQIKKDGTLTYTEVVASIIFDENSNPSKILGVTRNIDDEVMHEKIKDIRMLMLRKAPELNLDEFLNLTLDQVCKIAESPIGFFHFVNEVSGKIELRNWKPEPSTDQCKVNMENLHYNIKSAGIWAKCINTKTAIINNDYVNSANKKGYPEGHVNIEKYISIPIIRNDKVVAIFGIGNKKTDYTQKDVETITRIADLGWNISEVKIAENALRESEERLTVLINTLPDMICFKDASGKWLLANNCMLEILGLENVDYKYKNEDEIMALSSMKNKEICMVCNDTDQIAWETREVQKREEKIVTGDGKTHYFELTKIPLFNNDGSRKGIVVTGHNITQKKRYDEDIRKLSLAIEQSPVTIIITDIDANIEYANPQFTEVTGYKIDEILGKNPRVLNSGNTPRETYTKLWKTITCGKTWKGEFINKKKSGEIFTEEAIIAPMLDTEGKIARYIAIKEDITERKIIEEELIRAKEKAEEMNRVKNCFFANMSHELRTPMVGILGFSELLTEQSLDPEIKKMAEVINFSSKRLMNTLNMILNLSKIEAEKLDVNIESVNVLKIANEVVSLFIPQANKKNISLIIECPEKEIFMMSDEKILVQIFNNLINNAVKYTSEGFVKVSLIPKKINNANRLLIKIIDTGIGIPAEKQSIIWEEFRQVSEGMARSYEGTGLGLTLTRKFVRILGGEIKLESAENKGSIFTVDFPMEKIPAKKIPKVEIKKSDMDKNEISVCDIKPNLLYVENDFESKQLVKALVKNKYTITTADNDNETLKLIKDDSVKFDIILMDVNLGKGLDGFQLTKMIKQNDRYKNVPIIAVTAYAMYSDKEEALSAGCVDYISKPFTKNDFLTLLNKYTSKK